ncbi:MAG: DUF2769 domain-containing protein [Patescibacteria group bacterium]|nr:DUF2769 domain-containing protein [Patescibacteria group bacterium]
MKKPEDTRENLDRCLCKECGLYLGRACSNGPKEEKLYCARTVSECKMGQGVCFCPGCPVHKENNLVGAVFCLKEIEEGSN